MSGQWPVETRNKMLSASGDRFNFFFFWGGGLLFFEGKLFRNINSGFCFRSELNIFTQLPVRCITNNSRINF